MPIITAAEILADCPQGDRQGLKVVHWTILNGSGMHRVAESLATAESAIGLNSSLADPANSDTWDAAKDADVHVLHTHFPSQMYQRLTKQLKLVWVGHGTPDHVFQSACQEYEGGAYGHGDAIMLLLHWLREADARVTFWPRHKWIYDRMLSKGARKCDLVPLGVDTAFWSAGATRGKYAGNPSVFTAENPHYIKWPYDLFTLWPAVADEYPDARLHAVYVPRDLHRAFFPWINANGAAFTSYVSPSIFDKEGLRNAFQSCDFTIGLVRYGDLNHLSLQANAAGARTISYAGNPHSAYWITEGDQREMAKQLIDILAGTTPPRDNITPVPDISLTASAMADVYRAIL